MKKIQDLEQANTELREAKKGLISDKSELKEQENELTVQSNNSLNQNEDFQSEQDKLLEIAIYQILEKHHEETQTTIIGSNPDEDPS